MTQDAGGTGFARRCHMRSSLRTKLGALVVTTAATVGCGGGTHEVQTVPGPQLGESTASAPSDPTHPHADAPGVTGVAAPISVRPVGPAPASPAPSGAAAPGADQGPSGTAGTTGTERLAPGDAPQPEPTKRTDPGSPGVFAPPPPGPQ